MKIEFYPETCCDECDEVIHNHMNCPACNTKNASTDAYGEIDKYTEHVECEECNARFKLIEAAFEMNTWEVKRVTK